MKAAVEKAGSVDTDKVVAALKGMQIKNPGGVRTFRAEDQQFIYPVPAGRTVRSRSIPSRCSGDLKVFGPKDYYRHPPFAPVATERRLSSGGHNRRPPPGSCIVPPLTRRLAISDQQSCSGPGWLGGGLENAAFQGLIGLSWRCTCG